MQLAFADCLFLRRIAHIITFVGVMAGFTLSCSAPPPPAEIDEPHGLSVSRLACDLRHPWAIAVLPNGDALVSERNGGIRLFHAGKLQKAAIEGSPEVTSSFMSGQLDVAAHPDFANNRRVYLSYVTGSPPPPAITGLPGNLRLTVASASFRNGKFTDHSVLVQTSPIPDDHHFGGRLAFLHNGDVLVTTGDIYDDPLVAQHDDNLLGKVLRIKPDGRVSVFAKGLRNSQGLVVDGQRRVLAIDHGPIGGDELNLIKADGNYGWPLDTAGLHEGKYKSSAGSSSGGSFVRPIHTWSAPFAPSGLAIYEGDMFPEWRGQLLVGALAGMRIERLDISGPTVTHAGTLLGDGKMRIRDIAIANDGSVLAVTDAAEGCLLRLVKQH